MPPEMYIIVVGNIGTGKTTLCQHFAKRTGFTIFYETREAFLEGYYSSPKKFAFLNQLSYSLQFLEQAVRISSCAGPVIQDRSIYDTHGVFSRLQLNKKLISESEFGLLERIFRSANLLVQPSLLVMLDAPVDTVFARMKARGQQEEQSVTRAYLADLQKVYLEWYEAFTLCRKVLFQTEVVTPEVIVRDIVTISKTISPSKSQRNRHR